MPGREPAGDVVAFTRHQAGLALRGRESRLQPPDEAGTAPGPALALAGCLRLTPEFSAAAKLRRRF